MIALYIATDALMTLRALTSQYGERRSYYQLTRSVKAGEQLASTDIRTHEMFSNDVPEGALSSEQSPENFYSQYALPVGLILTEDMVAKHAVSLTDEDHRIIFIPTNDVLSESISTTTDLLSVSADGYSTEYVAQSARILFDLSENNEDSESPKGYFVNVSQDEAEKIVRALGIGDVRFALTAPNR